MVQGIAALRAQNPMAEDQAPPTSGSEDVISTLGQAFSSLSQKEIASLKELSDELVSMSVEELTALSQVIDFIQRKSDQYDIAVQTLIRQGIVEPGDLPPRFIPAFFDILSGLVRNAMQKAEAPPSSDLGPREGFAKGGIADLAKKGRNGDTMLAHLSPKSAATLKSMGGSGTINPKTGLPEFFLGGIFKSIGKIFKSAASVILPVALNFAFPGLGTIASGAIGAGVGALINGASPGQALGAALTGGVGGALMGGVSGMLGGQGFMGGITGALPSGFPGSTNTASYVPSFLGGGSSAPAAAGYSGPKGVGGLNEAAYNASTSGGAAAAAEPGMMSKIGGWMSEHPYLTAAGAALAGTALGSSLSQAKEGEAPTLPPGATPEMIAAARFPAGTFISRAAPKVQLTPTYSPAYRYGGEVAEVKDDLKTNPLYITTPFGKTFIAPSAPVEEPASLPLRRWRGKEKTAAPPVAPTRISPNADFRSRGIAPVLAYAPTVSPAYAMGGELDARGGGHLEGPGTGTSDSIPAKLSDGEFVMTAKAVRGAGGGSRKKGARKMYDLMHQFEKRA